MNAFVQILPGVCPLLRPCYCPDHAGVLGEGSDATCPRSCDVSHIRWTDEGGGLPLLMSVDMSMVLHIIGREAAARKEVIGHGR